MYLLRCVEYCIRTTARSLISREVQVTIAGVHRVGAERWISLQSRGWLDRAHTHPSSELPPPCVFTAPLSATCPIQGPRTSGGLEVTCYFLRLGDRNATYRNGIKSGLVRPPTKFNDILLPPVSFKQTEILLKQCRNPFTPSTILHHHPHPSVPTFSASLRTASPC